jgi:hypothetical protein
MDVVVLVMCFPLVRFPALTPTEAHVGDVDTAQRDFTRVRAAGQAEVVPQGDAGVFGAGDTALLAGSAPRGRRTTERDAGQEHRRRRQEREHGSRIIAAPERAWAAIRARHPEVPGVVIVTGAGPTRKGTPKGYQPRGHHWPERRVTNPERADL